MTRPYPRYRDSGVEWLGEVPSHWEVTRLGRVAACLDGRRIPLNAEERADRQGEYPYWGANGVLDYLDEWLFDEPLVLLGEDGAPFFSPNKRVAFSVLGKIWVNNHAHVLRPAGVHQRFLTDLLNITAYAPFIGGSTRDKLTQADMNGIPVPLPTPGEQRAIAVYLDRETGRVDALVAKKRSLLERLAEYRTALITRTVTKGLDPSVAMKDSGVEWLGDVPSHWEVRPLRRWFAMVNGGTPASGDDAYWDGGTVWLTPDDLGRNPGKWIREGRRTITEAGLRDSNARLSPNGSIVLSTRAPIGHIAIMAVPSATNQGCRTLVPDEKANSVFAYYVLRTSRPILQSLGQGSTFMELTPTGLGGLQIPLAPLDEQEAIIAFLDEETARIDGLSSRVDTAIERLQEYRTALVTAAVTGKIDVREPTTDSNPPMAGK